MSQLITCLWFDGQAEEAAAHYAAIFPCSSVGTTTRYGPGMPGPEGEVMTVAFTLDGAEFVGLNGGPQFTFSEAISFQILCDDQAAVDHCWERLGDGGEEGPCGWLKDRFGVSWQVVPRVLIETVQGPDRDAAQRTMQAMLEMGRLDVAALERAAAGEG